MEFYLNLAYRALREKRDPLLARAYLKRALMRANQLSATERRKLILAAFSYLRRVKV